MVIYLERDADLHMAQLTPLPLTVSCCSKIQIGFTFLVPAHLGSPGPGAVKRVCVCVCLGILYFLTFCCWDSSRNVYVAGFTSVVMCVRNGFTGHVWESMPTTFRTGVRLSVGVVAVKILRLKLRSFTASVGHHMMNLSM